VLPIICIALVLRLGHATEGACVLIWTCLDLRQRLIATWAEFQHSVVYYCANDQCRKRLEACINAEGGHSEHLLWHYLPDIPVATHHNRFFSVTDDNPQLALFRASNVWKKAKTFSQMQKVCSSQVSVVTFSGGVGNWITVRFLLWNNLRNQQYVWIILLNMTFLDFPRERGYMLHVKWTNV